MTLTNYTLKTANTPGMFILDSAQGDDPQLFTAGDLEQLRAMIDAVLPRHEHNAEPNDPDAHVLFDSVCCGAQLYRCSAVLLGGLPAKPTIHKGENECRDCGATLLPF